MIPSLLKCFLQNLRLAAVMVLSKEQKSAMIITQLMVMVAAGIAR
jgi:hypothetical protein